MNIEQMRAALKGRFEENAPKCVWSVSSEFPHIILKHPKSHESETKTFFNDIIDAFEYRRSISGHYYRAHKKATEFDEYRHSTVEINAQ